MLTGAAIGASQFPRITLPGCIQNMELREHPLAAIQQSLTAIQRSLDGIQNLLTRDPASS